jgi:hypothetical protein
MFVDYPVDLALLGRLLGRAVRIGEQLGDRQFEGIPERLEAARALTSDVGADGTADTASSRRSRSISPPSGMAMRSGPIREGAATPRWISFIVPARRPRLRTSSTKPASTRYGGI